MRLNQWPTPIVDEIKMPHVRCHYGKQSSQSLVNVLPGRVAHLCVSKLPIIASDNGLSPGRRQAIIWTSAGILLTGPVGTNFSEILIAIVTFSFTKMCLKVSSAKWRPCCLVLKHWGLYNMADILQTYWNSFFKKYLVFWIGSQGLHW